jgi:hypothetical protein
MVLLALALLHLTTARPVHEGNEHNYEYVFPDGNIYVYDLDNRGTLVKHISVPHLPA